MIQKTIYKCNICKQEFLSILGKHSYSTFNGESACLFPEFVEQVWVLKDGIQTVCDNMTNIALDENTEYIGKDYQRGYLDAVNNFREKLDCPLEVKK